jgi:hypothetical protein
VLDRIDANGLVTYVCRYCHEHGRPDYVVATPSGIGIHWGRHVKAGETKKQDRKVNTKRSDGVPVKHYSEQIHPRKHNPKPGSKAFREAERLTEREAAMAETIADVIEDVALEVAGPVALATKDPATMTDEYKQARGVLNRTPTIEDVKAAIAPLNDNQKIWAIRNIIDDGQVEKLQAENTRLATRVASLESDLRALKDLIGGIK